MELQKHLPAFREREIRIIGVSVDPPEKAKAMAERTETEFAYLSDEQGKLLDYYDIWHRRTEKSDIAIASSFLYAQNGELIWQDVTENYKVRPKPEAILEAADHYLQSERPR